MSIARFVLVGLKSWVAREPGTIGVERIDKLYAWYLDRSENVSIWSERNRP